VTRALALAALAVALAGCPKKSADAPPSNGGGGGGGDYDERQACTAESDCAGVEIACCDHCNGGTVVGIHRDHAAEVKATYRADCEGTICTEMGCVEDPAPICKQGICGVRIGTAEDTPALPPPP
jgi:hypothetical protein